VASAQADCINDAASQFPFAKISQFEAFPGVLDRPAVSALLRKISPLWISGTPSAPVYDYHSIVDEFAPIAGDRRLMRRFCGAGVPVQHVEGIASEHITLTVTGALGAIGYLGARFDGARAPSNCGSIPGA
jgi:hypothetical protein